MSTQVNPPPQLRIPEQFSKNRETFGYIKQLNQILFQLWVRTGGSDDTVSSSEDSLRQFEDLQDTVGRLHNEMPNVVAVSADYITVLNDIVVCTNTEDITVTLNAEPNDLERVTVKRTDYPVTIDGNGKTIDGHDTVKLIRKYLSLDLVYTVDNDSWSIV